MVTGQLVKYLENNKREYLHDLVEKNFYNNIQSINFIKEKIDNLGSS